VILGYVLGWPANQNFGQEKFGSHISVEWQAMCLCLQHPVDRLFGHGLSQASV